MATTRLQGANTSRPHVDPIILEGAKIMGSTYKNFSGVATAYNGGNVGVRTFCVIISDIDYARELKTQGWNVHFCPPRDENEQEFCYLPVEIRYHLKDGKSLYIPVYQYVGDSCCNGVFVDEGMIGTLDKIYIEWVDIRINGSMYKEGQIKAFLAEMHVHVRDDYASFGGKYSRNMPISNDDSTIPFN